MLGRKKSKKAKELDNNQILPEEILLHVFSFLSKKDRTRSSMVCKAWKRISEDNTLPSISDRDKDPFLHKIEVKKSLLTRIETLLAVINKGIKIGVIGENELIKKALMKFNSTSKSKHKFVYISAIRDTRNQLDQCDLILLCPHEKKNVSSQVKDFLFIQRTYLLEDRMYLIMNFDCEGDFSRMISFKTNDSLKELYKQIVNALHDAREALKTKFQANEMPSSHRCIVS